MSSHRNDKNSAHFADPFRYSQAKYYKANLSVRNTKFLILGICEGDLVLLWTLFLRNYKGDFGLDLVGRRKRPLCEEATKKAGVIP